MKGRIVRSLSTSCPLAADNSSLAISCHAIADIYVNKRGMLFNCCCAALRLLSVRHMIETQMLCNALLLMALINKRK